MWNAGVLYADLMAPPTRTTTAQGLLGGMVSLGGCFGNLLGGYLYDTYSPDWMWIVFAIITTVLGLVLAAVPMRPLLKLRQDWKHESSKMQEMENPTPPVLATCTATGSTKDMTAYINGLAVKK